MRRRTTAVAAGLIMAATIVTGCGDEGGDAQPAVEGTAFVDGAFDGLPMFRAATPIQRPTEKDGVVAGSFETITARPDTVISFYSDELVALGWIESQPPSEVGRDVWRGEWNKDARRLEVSTSPLPSDDATRTQIDLILHDGASS